MVKNLGVISRFCSVLFSALPRSMVTGPFTYQFPRSFFVKALQGIVLGGIVDPPCFAAATGSFCGLFFAGFVSTGRSGKGGTFLRLGRESEQLRFCALGDARYRYVGDHTAAEIDRGALGASTTIDGLQLPGDGQRRIFKRGVVINPRPRIETGLVMQDGDDGSYNLGIHPLGEELVTDREVTDFTLQPCGEFAVDHRDIGGKHEIVDQYRLWPRQGSTGRSLRCLIAGIGTAGNS